MNFGQYSPFVMTIVFIAIFYFLIIKPQRKREKKVKEMRNNLKIGDNVVTIGGIYGKVTKIKDDILTIEVGADKTKLQVAKWSIANLNNDENTK